jgi:isopenicillin N synthase-like dioxygenase
VARYYRGMERVSQALMRAVARGLTLEERFFDQAFDQGLSTLRLIRYPVRTDLERAARAEADLWVAHDGARRYVTGAPHVDSGFLTLLAQDGMAGLQARHRSGRWIDVPPVDEALAVNFGKVLER